MKKDYKNLYDDINKILSDWNPIGVDKEIALDEYKGYIPSIINASNSEEELIICLENILNELELGYNSSDPIHKNEIKEVTLKIFNTK